MSLSPMSILVACQIGLYIILLSFRESRRTSLIIKLYVVSHIREALCCLSIFRVKGRDSFVIFACGKL